MLAMIGICNAYAPDSLVRLRAASHVSLFMLRATPIPNPSPCIAFLAHCTLRLSANHSGYAPLWREQLGDAWREIGRPPLTWPVLAGDDERWAVRAAIDAVVAEAYGLSPRAVRPRPLDLQPRQLPQGPRLCLARFDELKQLGLESFTRKHDSYWDIPLNENLPQPVIDLPIPGEAKEENDREFRLEDRPKRGKGRNKK